MPRKMFNVKGLWCGAAYRTFEIKPFGWGAL